MLFRSRDQVADVADARITLWKDVLETWDEAERSKSRLSISPLKIKSWVYFPILKSKGVATESSYNGGGRFGDPSINFGANKGLAWELPYGIKSVSQIYNRISSPSASMFEGIDYKINALTNQILFTRDPFTKIGRAHV